MPDTKDLLERARRSAPRATFELTDLERRRDRRHARRKAGTIVVALALAAGTFGTAFLALREERAPAIGSTGTTGTTGTGSASTLPPATVAPLVADPGEYHLQRIRLDSKCRGPNDGCVQVPDEIELDVAIWWSPDESGLIDVFVGSGSYGITEGTFGPGEFPNGIDTSGFPTDPAALAEFLLARSQDDGASPAPLVSPPPEGDPEDGRMWRAITDVLQSHRVTPALRAALIEVAAGLQGSRVELDAVDPAGRRAHVVSMTDDTGELAERIFVDPASHELLAFTSGAADGSSVRWSWVIEEAGVAPIAGEDPTETSIPPAD